jgi:hypothetical protein
LFFFGERLRQFDQSTEVFVDVDATGVVVGNEFLYALD